MSSKKRVNQSHNAGRDMNSNLEDHQPSTSNTAEQEAPTDSISVQNHPPEVAALPTPIVEQSLAVPVQQDTIPTWPPRVDDHSLAVFEELPVAGGDEGFPWCENINWLPVLDDFDVSLMFDNGDNSAIQPDWQTPATSDEQSRSQPMDLRSIRSSNDSSSQRKTSFSRYVDGYGGRESLQKARNLSRSIFPDDAEFLALEFPLTDHVTAPSSVVLHQSVYTQLLENFHAICSHQNTMHKVFSHERFPEKAQMEFYMALYLEHFQAHFPFLHSALWHEQPSPWILTLAVTAIGSSYDNVPHCLQRTAAFSEFLRRAIRYHLGRTGECEPIAVAQAALLNCVLQQNSMDQSASTMAFHDLKVAMEVYQTSFVMFSHETIDPAQAWLKWQAWRVEESHVRLMWYSWLGSVIHLHTSRSDQRTFLPQQDLQLPCDQQMWEAATPASWLDQHSRPVKSTTLRSALRTLYIMHKVPTPLHSTSQVLLTYAILARTEEIAQSVRQPLQNWSPIPAGDHGSSKDIDEDESVSANVCWLPSDSRFAAWRNSACDCLDLLHWSANSHVAATRGAEGPILLHLHLARLLLLCPYREMVDLAVALKKRSFRTGHTLPTASSLDENLLKWLILDDHKGRLSLIHAGAIFWHLRRYSLGHFYEPFAIFVATLSIWLYGVYLPQVRGSLISIKARSTLQQSRPQSPRPDTHADSHMTRSESDESDLTPTNILLDRPCDDEMVQTFVRRGHEMRADLSGAADICTPTSQKVVLKEAIKLLQRSQYGSMAKSRMYREVLQRLAQAI